MLHTNEFIRQVSFRQDENRKSFYLLYNNEIYGVCIGLLRQELDTLIKLCYLTHENTTENERNRLMEMSLSGEHWNRITQNGKYKPLTDREMLNLASDLGGWESIVYKFGCKLIHLSNFHSYCENDPFLHMPHEEKLEIVSYITSYHG